MQPTTSDNRTPPEIVAAAEDSRVALATFIGQELENWGFHARLGPEVGTIVIYGDDTDLIVSVDGA